jgi:hypothetical protein
MLDHGLVRELNERLGVCERLQPALVERSSRLRCGQPTSGRRRVPNPPTRMMAVGIVSQAIVVLQLRVRTFHAGGGCGGGKGRKVEKMRWRG